MPPNVFGERARAYLSPACLRIDNSVRLSSSLPLWKGIVTLPSLVGCTYCLCEPFCSLNTQPSARIIFSISRGFNGIAVNSLQVQYTILYVLCQYVMQNIMSHHRCFPAASIPNSAQPNRPKISQPEPPPPTPPGIRSKAQRKAHGKAFFER